MERNRCGELRYFVDNMSPLGQSIYNTLAFFDAQDIPLTLLEVRSYLVAETHTSPPPPLSEIEKALGSELTDQVNSAKGFYFLVGRQELAMLRNQNYQVSLVRFRKIRRLLKILRFCPYLRAVALSGSQALLASHQHSDIDLFIITARNRIWLARTFVSFYFHILGQRRHGKYISSRFCLNHYLVEDTSIAQDQNLYTAVEYASLYPILGNQNLQKFWQDNNVWLREQLREPIFEENGIFSHEFSGWQKFLEKLLDFSIGPVLNYLAGIYQKHRIKLQDYILVSDQELSFHPGSTGQKVLASFHNRLEIFKNL